jgi:hypothetical protein
MLFMGLLEVFIRSQCDLEDPCGRPESRSVPDPIYDFIVVGGGSAGKKELVSLFSSVNKIKSSKVSDQLRIEVVTRAGWSSLSHTTVAVITLETRRDTKALR